MKQAKPPADLMTARGPVDRRAAIVILLVGVAVLAVNAWSYFPFFADDSFISLRYAQRFIEGHGLTWNDGERVEGYSNLLWVLLVSALGAMHVDLVLAARVLGFVCMSAVAGALVWACPPRRGQRKSIVPPLAGVLMLAVSGPIAIWALGGLEAPLLAALLAWATVLLVSLPNEAALSRSRILLAGLLLGLAVLTRPDAPLFVAVLVIGWIILGRFRRRAFAQAAALAALPVAFYVGQLVFRLAYYGDWLPNTAYVKVGASPERFKEGLRYVGLGLCSLAPLVIGATVGACVLIYSGQKRQAALLIALIVAWSLYLAAIGGDVFPGNRHLVPVIVIACLLTALGLQSLSRRMEKEFGIIVAVATFALALLLGLQAVDAENHRARSERWEWEQKAVGDFLRLHFGQQRPIVAVDAAGAVPYFSQLPCIDMLGLNDRHIARHPPEDFGKGALGHELGDGNYVLARRPDVVDFSQAELEPTFASGLQMFARPEFHRLYQPVLFLCPMPGGAKPFEAFLWIRREDSALGIQRRDDRITIPGYLLCPSDQVRRGFSPEVRSAVKQYSAGLGDGSGPICVGLLRAKLPSFLLELAVPPGLWRVKLEPSLHNATVLTKPAGADKAAASPTGTILNDSPQVQPFDIGVMYDGPGEAKLESLVLEREPQQKN